ncbi:hypothetical protein OCC_10329 [Thermococcus litoralis DSM 5473]|uniref:CARDB domain-containing protein n=1 Tax=Thermococcus litoralis (strain ATCC 51850 / DSM 5473 / JCM 8560 / NS-C) TaxID=523849 RepID=H3ZRB6_THELN|nr:hypothetical protein [Thermococcus litoralis]EHR77501.1 hypothetical protein OCC_10329 [Thermococcus litoralis DSM 5473]
MKGKIIPVFVFMLFFQFVAASSIVGWIETPVKIEIPNYTLKIEDISLVDGSTYVEYFTPNGSHLQLLKIGQNLSVDDLVFKIHRTIVGKQGYAYISLEYPYLLEGETILFGNYSLSLLSVGNNTAKIKLRINNESKEYTSTDIKYDNLQVKLTPYPKIFSGYLEKDETFTFHSHSITFKEALIENISGKYKNVVKFVIDKDEYEVPVGDTVEIGIFVISPKDLIGEKYVEMEVYLKGAYVNVYLLPHFEKTLKENENTRIGPYLVVPEYIFHSQAYVSIKNLCGKALSGSFLSAGNHSKALTYQGIDVGVLDVNYTSESKTAKLIIFVTDPSILTMEELIPEVEISPVIPSKIVQFDEVPLKIVLKNKDHVDLKNVRIFYAPSSWVESIGDNVIYVPKIEAGSSYEAEFLIRVKKYGKITLGSIRVIAETSTGFGCNENGTIEISHSSVTAAVEEATVKYDVDISAPANLTLAPFDVSIRIQNRGNTKTPVLLRIPVSKFAIINADSFTLNGSNIERLVSLIPNKTAEFKIRVFPLDSTNLTLQAYVISNGRIVGKDEEGITFTQDKSQEEFQEQNRECTPQIVYVNKSVPVEKVVERIVNNTVEVPYTPLKAKLIFLSAGFLLGSAFIILLAWIQSQRE